MVSREQFRNTGVIKVIKATVTWGIITESLIHSSDVVICFIIRIKTPVNLNAKVLGVTARVVVWESYSVNTGIVCIARHKNHVIAVVFAGVS